ncbi:MAG: PBP1A family penicillin-binding protein [Rhodospirillales bacterium]|nr:PBP1A family penicillin-binding protein [Rhodospirillales bacterium]
MTKKKSKSTKSAKKKKPSLLLRLVKALFVLGLWTAIILTLVIAWYATELPSLIDKPQFERKTTIYVEARDGSPLTRYGELHGVSVSVDELPPHLIYAVIATEDRRFYQHHGIDPVGIARAMAANLIKGRVAQGGSTITQQLAKNLFLSHERTLKRKIQEALLALWLEHELTKDEILSAYLNRVYLGSGAYGVDAAARLYFNKPASKLNLYESAMLAGLLKAPTRYSPLNNPELARQRTRTVLAAMNDAGYITEAQAGTSQMLPAPADNAGMNDQVRYFTDWVTADLNDLIGTPDRNITVTTTLDPDIQKAAEQALANTLNKNGEDRHITQGALIVMTPDGALLAMVGGNDFHASQFNRATQAQRPPGSAFKPIVYLTALEEDWAPDDKILDAPITEGEYRPENFHNEYQGEVTLEYALTHSLNTPTVRLMKQIGIGNTIQTARALGIDAKLNRDLSLALGSSGIPLLEMVTAYAVLANDGYKAAPYAITKIEDENGMLIYQRPDRSREKRVVKGTAVRDLTDMLENVIREGTGRRAALPGISAAGKTGTSQDFRDAWFIGYTDRFVAGVWLGNDDNSPMNGVGGGGLPAQIWQETMHAAYKKEESYKPAPSSPVKSSDDFSEFLRRIMNLND